MKCALGPQKSVPRPDVCVERTLGNSLRSCFWSAFFFLLHLLLLTVTDLPAPQNRHIESVPTRAGQQGTMVEVLILGNYIEDPREIIFYRPGIKAVDVKQIEDVQPRINLAHSNDAIVHQVVAKFVIAPDCPIGEHQFKLRTRTQLSTLSTFWVTPYPIFKSQAEPIHLLGQGESGRNDTAESAEPLPRESVSVLSQIQTRRKKDIDCYRISRKKGERISVEVDSVRLTEIHYAESEFDLAVRILDASGKELASVDDSALHVQDPILSILAPTDGDYIVEISQSLYKESRFVHYLAHIGDFERPLATFPAGGEAGKPLAMTLLGDPTGPISRKVDLPKVTRSEYFRYRNDAPSHLPMRVSPFPNVLEGAAGEINLPIALNGVITKNAETDRFRILGKRNTAYRVNVFARSIGTPLDPQIEIVHVESGEVEAAGDDATHAERDLWATAKSFQLPTLLDPAIIWTPKHDGPYELRIKDMRGLGGANFVYRIEIEPVENAVHTWMYARVIDSAECSKITAIAIPQDNRWTLNVRLADGHGSPWKGKIRLVPYGLPVGIHMNAPIVREGQKEVPVEFTALPGAKPQAGMFTIAAQPVDDNVELLSRCQQAMPFLSHSGARAWHTVIVDKYAYAITDPAPFRLEVKQPKIPLSKNGELFVKVRLYRAAGFDEPVEVNAYWVPSGVTAQPAARFEKGETELDFSFQANSSVKPDTWPVALQATTLRGLYFNGVGDVRVSSRFFDLEIAEPYVELRSQPVAIRRNQTGEFTFQVSHKKPINGTATVALLGLPKGVTAGYAELKSTDQKLTFRVRVSDEALLGQYKQLSCELKVREGDQEIRQRSGNGTLRIDPAVTP
ncbi:MAG: hypothetical protein ACI9G1_000281 [Pirellulaceae bacterium]|jgi:hypothetical protein